MSDKVFVTKSGFKTMRWDKDVREYVECPIQDILHYLRTACYIEEGVTLGDIFEAVASQSDLMDFIGKYAWCNVAAFHVEAKKTAIIKSGLDWLEIAAHFEICPIGSNLSIDFHGRKGNEETRYALDFTAVNEIVHLPLKLNSNISVLDSRDGVKELGDTPYTYSLLEVLSEIYYEISFHGLPQQRNKKMGELMDAVKEIESGTAILKPLDLDALKEKVN